MKINAAQMINSSQTTDRFSRYWFHLLPFQIWRDLGPHGENRAGGLSDHSLGHAPHQNMGQSRATVSTHHDEGCLNLLRCLEDLKERIPFLENSMHFYALGSDLLGQRIDLHLLCLPDFFKPLTHFRVDSWCDPCMAVVGWLEHMQEMKIHTQAPRQIDRVVLGFL